MKPLLKQVREAVAGGERDLFMTIGSRAESPYEAGQVWDVLERIACPAWVAVHQQIDVWVKTQRDADGIKAVDLSRRPGAQESLFDWLEAPGRMRSQVLQVLNVAILKA